MSFDRQCLDLAQFFLQDEPAFRYLASDLAQHIQNAIEDWFEMQQQKQESGENSE